MVARWLKQLTRFVKPKLSAKLAEAARAEARGDLEAASALFVEAGAREEASRVLLARANSALSGQERLTLLGLAREYAALDQRELLTRRYCELKLELCLERKLLLTRPELSELGRELSSLGAHRLAADAHGLAGDLDAQTAALVEAGAIERLEAVFDADESRQRAERDRQRTLARALDLERTGQRRAALALASDRPRGFGQELADIEQRIKSRRVSGALVHLELEGERQRFALGERVTLGRSHSSITVASPAVSREHLQIWSRDGAPVVADVSKNGTTLRGVPLEGPLLVHARLDLVLGGQVPVTLEPDPRFGVRLTVLEDTLLVPLAPLVTRVGEVLIGSDDWVELVAKSPLSAQGAPVYLDTWRVSEAVQLCTGDEFRSAPDGPVVLKVVR